MFWIFLTVMGGLVLLDVGIATKRDSGWWAAWGQWAGRVGSIAAAGAAVWIALEGWRRAEDRANEDQHRALASTFGVWIERKDLVAAEIKVVNGGPLPKYDVRLSFFFPALTLPKSVAFMAGEFEQYDLSIGTIGPTDGTITHEEATTTLMKQT
jgi:hypothetical protein